MEPFLQGSARTERLLVASDFDGVLAPIIDDPAAVVPRSESMAALRRLAALDDTTVALVSGRSYDFLEQIAAPADAFTLVGSHGAELAQGALEPDEQAQLDGLIGSLNALAERHRGLHVEAKALSVAAHLRRVEHGHDQAEADVDALAAEWPGKIVAGKEVVEFTLRHTTKGDAVLALADRLDATSTVYFGDDLTDEDVFVLLGSGDVGVKVGAGATAAANRVVDTVEVGRLLTALADARTAFCTGS